MLAKILSVLTKIVFWIFAFIFVAGFILIPIAFTWAIPSQGTKLLKYPVHLKSVEFNPFILQLKLNGFEILDHHDQAMIGFDQFMVQVNGIDLFKKIYHIEEIKLDGLRVNAELVSGNKINLLELVPQNSSQVVSQRQSKPNAIIEGKPQSLPLIIIDAINIHQGQIYFTDQTIDPHFSTKLSDMEVQLTHLTTDPKDQAKLKFKARLDGKGSLSMETMISPLAQPLTMEMTFSLNDYALEGLTPYVGKYTGHELKNGKLDVRMDYRISDKRLNASHRLLIQKFEFGKTIPSKDALHLPFSLAVALLQDPQGKINIALPVTGDMSDPKFKYSHLIVQVVRNFFLKLVTKPFSILGSMLGASDSGTDELGYVRFAPGQAILTDHQKQKLLKLIKGLDERPKLRLEIDGAYDPQVDWKELQAEVFSRDYEKLREESSRAETKVYQLLYQRRFGIRALWLLAKKYKQGFGQYQDEKLDQEIKRQLIENAPPDQTALSVLAQARAKLVYDFFVSSGLESARMSIGRLQATQSSMGYVPLPFTLTVFDK